jgi:hypothetical protein
VIRAIIGDNRGSTWMTYINWGRTYYYWECEIVSLPNGAICNIGGRTAEQSIDKVYSLFDDIFQKERRRAEREVLTLLWTIQEL